MAANDPVQLNRFSELEQDTIRLNLKKRTQKYTLNWWVTCVMQNERRNPKFRSYVLTRNYVWLLRHTIMYNWLGHWYSLVFWRWSNIRSWWRCTPLIRIQKSKFLDEFICNKLISTVCGVVLIPKHIFTSIFAQTWCRYTCKGGSNIPEGTAWRVWVLKSYKANVATMLETLQQITTFRKL